MVADAPKLNAAVDPETNSRWAYQLVRAGGVDAAFPVVSQAKDPLARSRISFSIALSLAELDRLEQSKTRFGAEGPGTRAVAGAISALFATSGVVDRPTALAGLMEDMVRSGMADAAEAAMPLLTEPLDRTYALIGLTEGFHRADALPQARACATDALKSAALIDNVDDRSRARERIARAYVGEDGPKALDLVAAGAIVPSIEREADRDAALEWVVWRLAQEGRTEEALEF